MKKWELHYTGKYLEASRFGINLFCAKERNDKWRMARLSRKGRMIGIQFRQGFIGHLALGGFQIFTRKFHVGFAEIGTHKLDVVWNGSIAEPYTTVSIVWRRFNIGMRSPKWLVKYKERAMNKYWAQFDGGSDFYCDEYEDKLD